MSKDEITRAFDEWRADAMRDVNKMPNRWEAFFAGWQACMEWHELGENNDNPVFNKQELGGFTDF